MLAISEHRARCRTNRASEFLLAARLLGSRARSAYQPGGCCSAWVLDYNCFFPKSEKFVWVLETCSVRLLARQIPQQVCSVRLLARQHWRFLHVARSVARHKSRAERGTLVHTVVRWKVRSRLSGNSHTEGVRTTGGYYKRRQLAIRASL